MQHLDLVGVTEPGQDGEAGVLRAQFFFSFTSQVQTCGGNLVYFGNPVFNNKKGIQSFNTNLNNKFFFYHNLLLNLKTWYSRGCFTNTFVTHSWSQSVIIFLQTSKTSFHPNRKSKGAEIFRECSPPTICHVSHVTCHMLHVTCQVSHGMCHMSHVICYM